MVRPSATVVSAHSTGAGGRPRRCRRCARRVELGARDPLHVGLGAFAGQHGFERFGVLAVIGQQQLEAHAELLQQLPAARALRGEVDERA